MYTCFDKRKSKSSLNDNSDFFIDIDKLIQKIIQSREFNERSEISAKECQAVGVVIRSEFDINSICIYVNAPVKVCGDIHGQFADLLRVFDLCGYPPNSKYLFLGDYVDRGRKGLEVLMLLFLYKIKYPSSIYLLRGNHECERITRVYGFRQEIKERFNSSKVWKTMIKTFQLMPMCAVIEKSIFCCHGGLSPIFLNSKYKTLDEVFTSVTLPAEVANEGLLCDLVWADPMDKVYYNTEPQGWSVNKRGCSWNFGYDIIREFLKKYSLDLIIRGHQVVEDGYEFYCDRSLVTLFTAPRYCGEFDNAGGIFVLEKVVSEGKSSTLEGSFKILTPDYKIPHQWFRNLKPKTNH